MICLQTSKAKRGTKQDQMKTDGFSISPCRIRWSAQKRHHFCTSNTHNRQEVKDLEAKGIPRNHRDNTAR